jgi:hypothetical protein
LTGTTSCQLDLDAEFDGIVVIVAGAAPLLDTDPATREDAHADAPPASGPEPDWRPW